MPLQRLSDTSCGPFWFGPLGQEALDAQLFKSLSALGGQPLRQLDQQLWIALDPPGYNRWRALELDEDFAPLLWLDPFERGLPSAYLARFEQVLGLTYRLPEQLPEAGTVQLAALYPEQAELLSQAGFRISSHLWLGYAPDFAQPEVKIWDALILSQTQLPEFKPDLRVVYSQFDASLQLLKLIRQSRVLILKQDLTQAEILPLLPLALAAGTQVLAEALPASILALNRKGLRHCPPEQLEQRLRACLAEDLELTPDSDWQYDKKLAPLLAELLAQPKMRQTQPVRPAVRQQQAPFNWQNLLDGLEPQGALKLLRSHRQGIQQQLAYLSEQLAGSQSQRGIWWEGPFGSIQSLALINDALIRHLPQAAPELPEIFVLPAEVSPEHYHLPTDWPQLLVSHQYPPRLQLSPELRRQGSRWVSIIPWEYGTLPKAWHQLKETDRVWVPSAAVRSAFWQAGFDWNQVEVLPNGVETGCFQPEGEVLELNSRGSFRFLFVGGCLERKGIDLLLKAYQLAFKQGEDVCLVIKDWGSTGVYALEASRRELLAALKEPGPEIIYLGQDELSAEQLAGLYRACNVYVHPYRGEGFGLPILEAMASGLPVIVPDSGPASEFCPAEAGWQVICSAEFEPTLAGGAAQLCGTPWWHVCKLEQLAACLYQAWQARGQLEAKQQAARQAALAYDWQLIAQRYAERLKPLLSAPKAPQPAPALRFDWQLPHLPMPKQLSWIDPERATGQIVPAWQGSADERTLWWLERLPTRQDQLLAETLWLAADPKIALELASLGVAPERIGCLALPWTFEAQPRPAASSGQTFLALCPELESSALRSLLKAWAEAFEPEAEVELLLACAQPDEEHLLKLLEAQIELLGLEACAPLQICPLTEIAPQRELLAEARACLLLESSPPLAWALAAQAWGCQLLSYGQYQALERPWSITLQPGQHQQLVYWLKELQQAPADNLALIAQQQALCHAPERVQGSLPQILT